MPQPRLEPSGLTRKPWPAFRRWLGFEAFIAAAIAATVLAVYFQDSLTRRSISFGPAQSGASFYAYSFDDDGDGGASKASLDASPRLAWRCDLQKKFEWPYCGMGLLFDRANSGKGFDFSGYESAQIRFDYDGPARFIRLVVKNHDDSYRKADGSILDKPEQVDLPVSSGPLQLQLHLSDLAVADWWKSAMGATPERARPEFQNVTAIEFVFGSDGAMGEHKLRIREISFERRLIGTQAFYGAIALCWLVLIGGMLLYRRRHIRLLTRSAGQALRDSERLYRTILETSTDCIILHDLDGNFEFVNSAAVAALELPPLDQLRGRHWSEFWTGEAAARIDAAIRRAVQGQSARLHGPAPTAKGTQRWWDAVVLPTYDDAGAVSGVLSVSRDLTVERERSEQLKWASEHDALTHLPNRRSFQARLQAATVRAMQAGEQVGLLIIDLDHFKHVNDSLGHSAGDDLLKIIAERLRHCVRESDFVARIGGDEFAILVENAASAETLLSVGKQVQDRLRAPVRAGGRALGAGASIGGALFPSNAANAHDLFKYADTALYELKQHGRGGTKLFDDYMLAEAEKTATQLNLARGALTEKSVVPLYQPKVDIATGEAVGLEALLRWKHPRRGLQLPATLEEAFNDYELAAKIGELMQQKVARDLRGWLDSGVAFGRVSINAAPAEFLRDDYAERLLAILAANEVPASRIEVEVTEHAFLGRGPEYVARALGVLKEAGATVSLDDFGTGCSSLAHLRDFPVDVVKVDKSFVQQMTDDPEIAAIVAAVVDLANSLSITVVAEGVETPTQLELLRVMGCRIAQGHLFGAAVGAREVPGLMPAIRAAA
jgi:diguanylate cyclase (GGDEF)-like protein/PAS domain S-box-containing protein